MSGVSGSDAQAVQKMRKIRIKSRIRKRIKRKSKIRIKSDWPRGTS